MSTITVRSSSDAAGAVSYVLYGHDREREMRLVEAGQTRAAAYALSMAGQGDATPADFIERAELLARVHGRAIQLYSYVLAFHPKEFDVSVQEDMERVRDIAVELTERMHSADYMVVVHDDSAAGHGHAHILALNHDNLTGKAIQRYTSWLHGLHQLNDELMLEKGLDVVPSVEEPKPGWGQRRFEFADDGFEKTLGDRIHAAVLDARSVDRASYERVLAESGITLTVTHRDGWSYKMRRHDNGKIGRRKASRLTPDFTAEALQQAFDYRATKGHSHVDPGRDQSRRRAAADFGDVGAIDIDAPRRRAAAHTTDGQSEGPDQLRQRAGRGDERTPGPAIDHAAIRAALGDARRRDGEQADRDGEDAPRHRVDPHPLADSAAAERRDRDTLRARRVRDDDADPAAARDDGYELS